MLICPSCNGTFPAGKFCPKDGTRLMPEEGQEEGRDPLVGQVVAERFRVVRRLGSGGMGTVYEAEHTFIKKRVALKLLRGEITSNPEAVARFQREALAASTIGHENIVAIDDFGRLPDGQVYLTMEYLDGEPLNAVIARSPMPVPQVLDVAMQVCDGLAVAHEAGIVHRDMKPENLFLVDGLSRVKILDFGIAKVSSSEKDTNLTKTGAVFGTPNYMSPEQALGRKVDHRTDIYSLGVILYEMLCGQVPFQSESFLAVLTQHVTATPAPPSEVATRPFPDELEQVVLRAMAKDEQERFESVRELRAALAALRDDEDDDYPTTPMVAPPKDLPPLSTAPPTQSLDPAAEVAPASTVIRAEPPQPGQTATAGELVAAELPPRRRTGLIIALLGAVVLLGGGGALAYFHFSEQTPPDTPLATAAAANPETPAAAPRPAPGPAPAVAPKAAPGPGVEKVEVILATIPTPAKIIYQGSTRTGETPDVIPVVKGSKLVVVLSHAGYRDQRVELKGDRTRKMTVRLKRLRRRPRTKRPTPRAPRPPPRTKKPPKRDDQHDHDSDHGSSSGSSHDEVINPGYNR